MIALQGMMLLIASCSTASDDDLLVKPEQPCQPVEPSLIQFTPQQIKQSELETKATLPNDAKFTRFYLMGNKQIESQQTQYIFSHTQVSYSNNAWTYDSPRYWDMNATKYQFWAYSTSEDMPAPTISSSSVTFTDLTAEHTPYIALVEDNTVTKEHFNQQVKLQFKQLAAQVRFGFYETVAGKGIQDLVFRVSGKGLNTGTYKLTAEGLTYANPSVSKAIVPVTRLSGNLPADLNALTEGTSLSSLTPVLPLTANQAGDLTITILQITVTDDSDSDKLYIPDKELTATIPASFCIWSPNFCYTYLLKLTSVPDASTQQIQVVFDNTILEEWKDLGKKGIYDFLPNDDEKIQSQP